MRLTIREETMNKRGFTIIESLVVLMIISILVSFAIPRYIEAKKTAQAAKAITDFEAIRTAVISYYSDSGDYPPDYLPGKVPPEIQKYLPESFSFDLRPEMDIRYDWDNWVVNGKPKHPNTNVLYGVSVTTTDPLLIKKIKGLYRGPFLWTINQNYTFVFEFIQK